MERPLTFSAVAGNQTEALTAEDAGETKTSVFRFCFSSASPASSAASALGFPH